MSNSSSSSSSSSNPFFLPATATAAPGTATTTTTFETRNKRESNQSQTVGIYELNEFSNYELCTPIEFASWKRPRPENFLLLLLLLLTGRISINDAVLILFVLFIESPYPCWGWDEEEVERYRETGLGDRLTVAVSD